MTTHVDDLTVEYMENGVVVVKELDKVVLSKGAWSTIIFRYREWDTRKNDYGPERFTIRRYRKVHDEYRQQSKFNISSADQARRLVAALQGWVGEEVSKAADE